MNFVTQKMSAPVVTLMATLLVLFVSAQAAQALITTTMDPEDNNSQVSELQAFLALDSSIYPEGIVTGYYGTLTTAAVERFQCVYDIICSGSPVTTGYGRVGPLTLAEIRVRQGGVSLPPVGIPSTGGDVNAPILNPPTVATTSVSALIAWTTNEAVRSRVMYATAWPFLFATAPSVADTTFDSTSAVQLLNLSPDTTYHYVRESIDAAGNVQYGIGTWFRTGN